MENHESQFKPEKPNQLEDLIRELNESTEREIENVARNKEKNSYTEKILRIFKAYRDKISEIARDMAKIYK